MAHSLLKYLQKFSSYIVATPMLVFVVAVASPVHTVLAQAPSPTPTSAEEKTCTSEVDGIGWWLCGLIEAGLGFSNVMWDLFDKLLVTQPLDASDDNSIFKTWQSFRDIGNALLGLIFLVVIFSQVSNIGISNYGIKKVLPRLLIMALLVNISFFLLQASLDLANIAGKTIQDLLIGNTKVITKVGLGTLLLDIIANGITVAGTAGALFVVGSIVGGKAMALFIAMLLIPILLGFVAGLLALMFRTALLPMIAILAPIALVAYVLPNTQSIFDKWRKLFLALLLLYPLAAFYMGALQFMAILLIGDGGVDNILGRLMGFVLLFTGAGGVAAIAVKSNAVTGKIAGTVGGAMNKVSSPLVSYGKGNAMDKMKDRSTSFAFGNRRGGLRGRIQDAMSSSLTGKRQREGRRSAVSEMSKELAMEELVRDPRRTLGTLYDDPAGQRQVREAEAKMVIRDSAALATQGFPLNSDTNPDDYGGNVRQPTGPSFNTLRGRLAHAIDSNDRITAQAVQNQMLAQGGRGLEQFNEAVAAAEIRGTLGPGSRVAESLKSNMLSNHSGALQQDFATREWAQSQRTMADSRALWSGGQQGNSTGTINAQHFAGMSAGAQLRALGASADGSSIVQGGGDFLDDTAIRAMLDSSTDLGRTITRGSATHNAIRELANQRGIAIPGPQQSSNTTPQQTVTTGAQTVVNSGSPQQAADDMSGWADSHLQTIANNPQIYTQKSSDLAQAEVQRRAGGSAPAPAAVTSPVPSSSPSTPARTPTVADGSLVIDHSQAAAPASSSPSTTSSTPAQSNTPTAHQIRVEQKQQAVAASEAANATNRRVFVGASDGTVTVGNTSTTDGANRQQPASATEDYHDRMSG